MSKCQRKSIKEIIESQMRKPLARETINIQNKKNIGDINQLIHLFKHVEVI